MSAKKGRRVALLGSRCISNTRGCRRGQNDVGCVHSVVQSLASTSGGLEKNAYGNRSEPARDGKGVFELISWSGAFTGSGGTTEQMLWRGERERTREGGIEGENRCCNKRQDASWITNRDAERMRSGLSFTVGYSPWKKKKEGGPATNQAFFGQQKTPSRAM